MRADLHIHSLYSKDGRSSVNEIIKAAKAKGLGCIAIADHNSFESFKETSGCEEIIIIPAEEVSSSEGHILAYGINCEIPRGKGVLETIDMIHDAAGVAVAAHPYRWWSGLGERNVVNEFDAVEVFNARATKGSNNKAHRLASKMKKPMTAGSDAHHADSVGDAYTELPDANDWEEALKAVLRGGAATGGKNRTRSDTLRYGFKSITEWIGRGFRKM
jgi:predicted metal-dependent phosphoesterase TrpH